MFSMFLMLSIEIFKVFVELINIQVSIYALGTCEYIEFYQVKAQNRLVAKSSQYYCTTILYER